jgi:hypothetical protein
MCRLILCQITRGVSRKPGQYSKGLEFIAATFDVDMVAIFIAVWSRKGTTPHISHRRIIPLPDNRDANSSQKPRRRRRVGRAGFT